MSNGIVTVKASEAETTSTGRFSPLSNLYASVLLLPSGTTRVVSIDSSSQTVQASQDVGLSAPDERIGQHPHGMRVLNDTPFISSHLDIGVFDAWRILTFSDGPNLTGSQLLVQEYPGATGVNFWDRSLECDGERFYRVHVGLFQEGQDVGRAWIQSYDMDTLEFIEGWPQENTGSTKQPELWSFAPDNEHIYAIRGHVITSDPFPLTSEFRIMYGTVDDWSTGTYDESDPHIIYESPDFRIVSFCVDHVTGDLFLAKFDGSNEPLIDRLDSTGTYIQTYNITQTEFPGYDPNNSTTNGAMCASGGKLFAAFSYANSDYSEELVDGIWMIDASSGDGATDPMLRLGLSGGTGDLYGTSAVFSMDIEGGRAPQAQVAAVSDKVKLGTAKTLNPVKNSAAEGTSQQ